MRDKGNIPNLDQCIKGRVYKIHCRNLAYGVYDGKGGFIGIREKFNQRYLFTEYHWDFSEHYGTVGEAIDLTIDLPNDIPLETYLETIDEVSKRPVSFDRPVKEGGRGWFFTDTNEENQEIRPIALHNDKLFQFLELVEKDHARANQKHSD